ncbi:MAG: 4Fe-4S binding protein [Ruminococcaceae bacterium]|nr:4Fe-4S binding protein [Oscillospiraceae bacterium]
MEYRRMGTTDMMAGVIGIGSEGFVHLEDREALNLISYVLDRGVNYIDIYNPQPNVRINIGKGVLGRRDKVYIQAHLGTCWDNGQYRRTRDVNETKNSFEEMMKLMQTDYMDVGMFHYVDNDTDFDIVFDGGLIEYALKLKKEGTIRYIGLSSHNPRVARRAVEKKLVDVVLFAINPAYDMQPPDEDLEQLWADENYEKPLSNIDVEREEFHKLCSTKGVGISVMKAFGGGDLLSSSLSPFGVAMTPAQYTHYALSRPGVGTVACGLKSIEEARQALEYFELSEEEKDFSVVLSKIPKHTFRGKCMYCGHCAPCTVGIDVASVNKFHDLAATQDFIPETVREHYASLEHHAGECISCGACMENCPFEVDIISAMKKAKEMFSY